MGHLWGGIARMYSLELYKSTIHCYKPRDWMSSAREIYRSLISFFLTMYYLYKTNRGLSTLQINCISNKFKQQLEVQIVHVVVPNLLRVNHLHCELKSNMLNCLLVFCY